MPTEWLFESASRTYERASDEFAELFAYTRSVLDLEPFFGGLVATHTAATVEDLERSAASLAMQCEFAAATASARAASIRVWREDELAYRAAYDRWRDACASLEVENAAILAAADIAGEGLGGAFITIEAMPPEPVPPPEPPEWADLELPPRIG